MAWKVLPFITVSISQLYTSTTRSKRGLLNSSSSVGMGIDFFVSVTHSLLESPEYQTFDVSSLYTSQPESLRIRLRIV